jgi:hypothetical protein
MKNLVGKKITKKIKVMGENVEIRQLSVSQVKDVQKLIKESQDSKSDDSQMNLLHDVIRIGVVDAEDMTAEDFDSLPLAELNNVVNSILEFSGLGAPNSGN